MFLLKFFLEMGSGFCLLPVSEDGLHYMCWSKIEEKKKTILVILLFEEANLISWLTTEYFKQKVALWA